MEKTVTVQYVNPPKGNSKSHTIKTTDGEIMGFFADKLRFEKGGTYRILVEERIYNDKTYLNAVKILEERKPAANSAGAPSAERWWMPFVSNTVAHALQSGRIEDASQIKVWAAAAKQAAMELDQEPIKPKDIPPYDLDDIPQ